MKTRVQKWGNSLALRIPKAIALEAGLTADAAVDVRLHEGKVIVEALVADAYTLSKLLDAVTAENIHAEIDTGPTVGNEAW